jgi:spore germination cell wall hydrolase CwlJ-like protein
MNAPALHPSERPAPRWPVLALAGVCALAVVLLCALGVRAALAELVPQPLVLAAPAPVRLAPIPVSLERVAAADAIASPAAGTTGTAALPPVPVAAMPLPTGDTGITAARAFSVAGLGASDRARAIECLTAAIYYEAASEPDDGQRAVAQVVLNRVRHPAFPSTVCGVVYQGSERAGCQFSFACDGAMARVPSRSGWARAARVAGAALGGYVFAPVGLATHYHTYAVTPAWNRTLVMTDAVGAHFFHRWKGYWGTAAAFVQRYRGGEPMPGPHQRIAAPAVVALSAPAPITVAGAAQPAVALPALPSPVQPAHAASGEPVTPAALPESQVLDRWKDSGRPLR